MAQPPPPREKIGPYAYIGQRIPEKLTDIAEAIFFTGQMPCWHQSNGRIHDLPKGLEAYHGECAVQAYNGYMGAESPVGSKGTSPDWD